MYSTTVMRIAIDARAVSHPQPGGFKSYVSNLVAALLRADDCNGYVLYFDRPQCGSLSAGSRVCREVVPAVGGWLGVPTREQVLLPLAVARGRVDVLHSPCSSGPVLTDAPLVATIHDAIEFLESPPAQVSREGVRRVFMARYNRWVQRMVARRATRVITDSAHSKRDLGRILAIPEEKIRVIPLAQAERYQPCRDESLLAELRQRYALPEGFVLALANASARKNARGLLRIYAHLPLEVRQRHPLVVVLSHGLFRATIDQEVRRHGLADSVRFVSGVPDADLALFYNAATVFIFPSLYEGFGLPVLEAMACGTPVVASNLTSIPEVAGEAVELADPRDEVGFARALSHVLASTERRAALATRGLARARQFSWDRTARLTLDIYHEAARGNAARCTS